MYWSLVEPSSQINALSIILGCCRVSYEVYSPGSALVIGFYIVVEKIAKRDSGAMSVISLGVSIVK